MLGHGDAFASSDSLWLNRFRSRQRQRVCGWSHRAVESAKESTWSLRNFRLHSRAWRTSALRPYIKSLIEFSAVAPARERLGSVRSLSFPPFLTQVCDRLLASTDVLCPRSERLGSISYPCLYLVRMHLYARVILAAVRFCFERIEMFFSHYFCLTNLYTILYRMLYKIRSMNTRSILS